MLVVGDGMIDAYMWGEINRISPEAPIPVVEVKKHENRLGGAANVETIKNGFKIILSDSNVKSILINIFGGIVRCDRVANGVIQAVKELELDVSVVVRLQGTNADVAKKILDESDISIISAETINEAAEKAVEAVK